MELTKGQREALYQIACGVFPRRGGWYDEDGNRLNLRDAQRLADLGLLKHYSHGGAPMRTNLDLSPAGWEVYKALFEGID